jgi:hypothetical protein
LTGAGAGSGSLTGAGAGADSAFGVEGELFAAVKGLEVFGFVKSAPGVQPKNN